MTQILVGHMVYGFVGVIPMNGYPQGTNAQINYTQIKAIQKVLDPDVSFSLQVEQIYRLLLEFLKDKTERDTLPTMEIRSLSNVINFSFSVIPFESPD